MGSCEDEKSVEESSEEESSSDELMTDHGRTTGGGRSETGFLINVAESQLTSNLPDSALGTLQTKRRRKKKHDSVSKSLAHMHIKRKTEKEEERRTPRSQLCGLGVQMQRET